MIKKSWALLMMVPLLTTAAYGDSKSEWFSDTALSPDGETIAFSYKGDIYTTSSAGGVARALTVNAAWEGKPVWSPDGRQLAFASNRHGNLDVFIMPSSGGKAKRLTYHSSHDTPSDFSTDGARVLFSSGRMGTKASSISPVSRLAQLYEVATSGGTPTMTLTTPASEARWDSRGTRLIYRDEKGFENP